MTVFHYESHHEIIRKLDEILAQNEIIRSDQLHIRKLIMANLQEVKDGQAAETAAIVSLAARLAGLPQPAATEADLDSILSTAQANKAAIDAIAPAPTV